MNEATILLGGNLSDRQSLIGSARDLIAGRVGNIVDRSSLYETEPWGFNSDTMFLNQVVVVKTELEPGSLMNVLVGIEKDLGRTRNEAGYASRLIDLDILFYNDEVISSNQLVIPHPRIQERMFALKPLEEINRRFVHPVLKKPIHQLVEECPDDLKVVKYSEK